MSVSIAQTEPRRPRTAARQVERRRGITELLAAISQALGGPREPFALRAVFEQRLGSLIPVREVQLRLPAGRHLAGVGGHVPPALETVSLDVPGSEAALHAVIEPGDRLGDWEQQMLGAAAHVAALVLEIERNRALLPRAGLQQPARTARDRQTPIVGDTPAVAGLRSTIERVAGTDFTVLLEGESGVGKELVARQIHQSSRRRNGPFVAVNCAALVETLVEAELFGIEERTATGVRGRRGKFEHAEGGTLFLDEVSDLSLPAQAKLLRALQDLAVERVGGNATHRVDIRVVAATNRRLADLVAQGAFRPDLFYRLSGVDIRVPSLRERQADILVLAHHFLARHRSLRPLRLSATAADALASYEWPGNVRELERVIERAVALAETDSIELGDLPPLVHREYAAVMLPSLERDETLRAWGARYARLVLTRCQGNKREACRVLDISYHTLQAYLRFGATDATAGPVSGHAPGADPGATDDAAQSRGEVDMNE
jgi:DNA-binding NtrC family response regulator